MHMRSTRVKTLLTALLLVLTLPPALAADNPTSSASTDSLATARSLVTEKKWPEAIRELARVNETRSADWNNLMGFSLRKAPAPDLDAAERYYAEALRINAKHLGALEYSGELYLMKGDLAKAEQRLVALDKACFLPCEEYQDLKRAVQNYKANGNRYVQTP